MVKGKNVCVRTRRGSRLGSVGLLVVGFGSMALVMAATTASVAEGQSTAQGVARQVQVLESDRTGVVSPAGIAFSPRSRSFYAIGRGPGGADTEVVRLDTFAGAPVSDRAGSARIAAVLRDPVNVAFDARGNRLLMLDNADRLLEVRVDANGDLDPETLVRRDALRLDLRDPQGMTVDSGSGAVYVLDADSPRLLRIEPDPDGSFDAATVSEVDLRASGLTRARGLAFDPVTGHLHIGGEQRLFEVSPTGETLVTRDLSGTDLHSPAGMTVAPSGDRTDAPGELSLYVADPGGQGSGQIVELSLAPMATAQASTFTSSLVRTTDFATISPPSPDSSGIGYVSTSDRLVMVDGEVEETVNGITHFQDANLWELSRNGSVARSANISTVGTTSVPMTDEPTGVAFKPSNGHYFVSDDSQKRVYELNPGTDALVGTADDTWTFFSTTGTGNTDPEGVAYDSFSDQLLVADGVNREVYRYTTAGALVGQFDTQAYGVEDPESVEFNSVSGTVFVLSNRQSGPIVIETTPSGTLLTTINVAAASSTKPAGLAYAPASDTSGDMHFYIVDRGIDNNSDPNIVDGKMFEMTAPPPGTPGNAPPQVSAGPDLNVALPGVANLDGTVTDDDVPQPFTHSWTQVSGPSTLTFQDAGAIDTTANVPIPGTYVVRLTASDGEFTVSDEATLLFTGTGSVSFLDKQIGVSSDDAEQLAATNGMRLANADLDLMLDDGGNHNVAVGLRFTGLSIPQGANVTYAYVQFEANGIHTVPTTLTFKGQAADNAPTFVSQNSNITSRPTTTATTTWSPDPWVTSNEAGFLQRTPSLSEIIREVVNRPGWVSSNALVLIVTGSGQRSAEAWDSNPAAAARLHVEWTTGGGNQPPQVNAGPDDTITLPAGANLNGTVTDDGSFTTTWSKLSGPGTVTFGNASAVDTTASFSVDGTYVLQLLADDGQFQPTDTVQITVNPAAANQPPQVNAGPDDTITLPAGANLNGTVTDDGSFTTTWSKLSGPGTVTFGNASAVDTTASFSVDGTYVLQLMADDGQFQPTDTVQITVNPAAANQPPQVNAGPDDTITLPASANLNGTVTDDGSFTTTWSKLSGPGTVTFADASAVDTTASFSVDGTYVLQLMADDGQFQPTDTVQITVNPAAANQPPQVNAGPDDTITLPASANLNGTVTDDGQPSPPSVTTTWSLFSGPQGATVTFGNANAIDTTATFSSTGTYVLRLTAFDGQDQGFDDVIVTVTPATLYFSVTTAQTLNGIPVTPQDVVAFDGATYSLILDGSDVGLDASSESIDALALLPDGRVLVSTTGNPSVVGVSGGRDEDVIALTPTLLGGTTSGTWAMYFDGSVVGLEASGEDVDAIEPVAGGLLVSTSGAVSVTGVTGADEDVLQFTSPNSWAMYFDGSDVGLSNSSEDVDGLAVRQGNVYLSTTGNFGVTGLSGADEDVFACNGVTPGPTTLCASFSLYFDGSTFGLAANDLFAIEVP